jgi:Arc/MetJ family transcription regulator
MPTNLAIDDRLIVEAQKLGGHKSKKETVNQALAEYIRRHQQQKILGLFGKVEWNSRYDYKTGRKRP